MAKQDVIDSQLKAIEVSVVGLLAPVKDMAVQVLSPALGAAFDAGIAEGGPGGFTQGDIDAAVKAAVDPLNAQVAKDAGDLAAAHADADQKLSDLQMKLDAMSAQDQADKALVANFQGSIDALQKALDALKAALPVVAPAV